MKVVRAREGRYVLNPVRLVEIMQTDGRGGGAGGVLGPDYLVISTVPCSSHHDAVHEFGVDLKDVDWRDPDDRNDRALRLQLGPDIVEVEFWAYDFEPWANPEGPDYDVCAIDKGALDRLGEYVRSHPLILRAYGRQTFSVQITVRCDADPIWNWIDGVLDRDPDSLTQAPAFA